jgi:hypothetical protein
MASAVITCDGACVPEGGAPFFLLSPHEMITELNVKKNITESSLKLFTFVQL